MGHLVTDRNEEERHNTLSQFFIIKIESWSTGLSRTIAVFLTIHLTYRASLFHSLPFLLLSFFYVCCSLFCVIFLKLLKSQIAISRVTRIRLHRKTSLSRLWICVSVRGVIHLFRKFVSFFASLTRPCARFFVHQSLNCLIMKCVLNHGIIIYSLSRVRTNIPSLTVMQCNVM